MGNEHVSSAAPRASCFTRRKTYRGNGHSFVSGDEGRREPYDKQDARVQDVLRKLGRRPANHAPAGQPQQVELGSPQHAARYHFAYGTNFQGSKVPYGNEAHHCIPVSAFSDPPFAPELMALLVRVDGYDVNEGENIIFLPRTARDAVIHNLPTHNGDHPAYTDKVRSELTDLAQSLREVLASAKPHEQCDPPSDIPDTLRSIQADFYQQLVNLGQRSVNTL